MSPTCCYHQFIKLVLFTLFMSRYTFVLIVTLLFVLSHSCHVSRHTSPSQGTITNMLEEKVVQPLLVTSSAITLATECVRMILKIDDIVPTR